MTTTVAPSDVTVLLADDDMEILRVLHKSLDKQGYQVHQAHDGAEALESALVVKPNVIILDVMMPELTGWEVCKNLLRLTVGAVVVVVTVRKALINLAVAIIVFAIAALLRGIAQSVIAGVVAHLVAGG